MAFNRSNFGTRDPSAGRAERPGARAFTLIELLVVIGVIVLLSGLLVVAVGAARSAARDAATRQTAANLSAAVQSFRNDFGFVPPLVKDNNTRKWVNTPPATVFQEDSPILNDGTPTARLTPETFRFSTARDNSIDRDYLRLDLTSGTVTGRDWYRAPDFRFSEYSLAYYLVGALPAEVDGVEGPGFVSTNRSGGFIPSGQTYAPYYDVADQGDAIALYLTDGLTVAQSAAEGRFELRDDNGVAFRYYRWLKGNPAGGDSPSPLVETPEDLRIPFVVAGSSFTFDTDSSGVTYADNAQLQQAEWAIVAAGADGVFGDLGTEGAEAVVDATGRSVDPADASAVENSAVPAAQADNVVELGR